jgi:hypothetical protein
VTTTPSHPIMGFNVSWFAIVKTKLANGSWHNSFDEIHDFFFKVIFEFCSIIFYALLVHFGFIKD